MPPQRVAVPQLLAAAGFDVEEQLRAVGRAAAEHEIERHEQRGNLDDVPAEAAAVGRQHAPDQHGDAEKERGQRRPYALTLEWRLEVQPILDASLEQ